MGVRGNIGIQRFNELQKRKRRKLNDPLVTRINSSYRKLKDHKKMKGHEFAMFQKEQYQRAKLEKKKRRIIMVITIILTVFVILSLPYLLSIIFG